MITKAVALVSFAAGYVAGSAAGRERYEQIRSIALGVAHEPRVQKLADEAAAFAHERGAVAAEKITGHHAAGAPDNPTAEDIAISLHL